MAREPSGVSRRYLRILFDAGGPSGLTDGQLLERFATRRGEAAELAFAALVERHGPMVLRACRGILREDHEAMDAFQATFLVLARKGGALWVRDSLGPWLHRVACRAAARARAQEGRRRALELRLAEHKGGRTRDGERDDLAAALHEELDRLPERFRVPIVLCDLEGRTCEEAARHLGCPIGTIGSRLVRGRERLRDRLRRRGMAPNAGLLASSLGPDGPDALTLIPPALVDTTTAAVLRFVSARTVAGGSAALLAQGVLSSMTMLRWMKVASVVLALGATASGVNLLAQKGTSGSGVGPGPEGDAKSARGDDMPVFAVKPGKLTVSVVERGSLESSRNNDVWCQVEGQTTIISILPEGSYVTKGQPVCKLDTSTLKDNLINQKITAQGAEAAYQNAQLAVEDAKTAVREYVEGTLKHDQDALKGAITIAESAIRKADSRLERTRRARKQLNDAPAREGEEVTPADVVAGLEIIDRLEATEQALLRERLALELARTKQQVLETYTKDRMIKGLEKQVERNRSDVLAKKANWELEKARIAKLEEQIKNCTLYAPREGMVMHVNDPNRPGRPQIEEGATVRERQLIFRVPDLSQIRVNAKVSESMIARIKLGLRARVEVDAFPKLTLTGVVKSVSPLPEPTYYFSRNDPKVFSTLVELEKFPRGLRPGMTAQVEILVNELDDVLTVPVTAVLVYQGKAHVAVKRPDGGIDWREVGLGVSNDSLIEVTQGIKSGESVALNPIALMSEEERREKKIGVPTEPAAKPSPPE